MKRNEYDDVNRRLSNIMNIYIIKYLQNNNLVGSDYSDTWL